MKDLKKIDNIIEGIVKTVIEVIKTILAYLNIRLDVVVLIAAATILIMVPIKESQRDGVFGAGMVTLIAYIIISAIVGYMKRKKEE